ncbi:MAG TPA: glycerophosphodiester phosphodiesterase [Gaiellaceae bacterium]|nr:glycerophosphodiester phosphodiesterase [Gaiellaceae bacterium]
MNLRAAGRPLVVGHKGAAALAPENTLASLERAVALGCDLVEFDVLELDGRLVLAHSPREVPAERASLDDALELLAATGAGIHLDLKWHGYEAAVADALRRHDVLERTLVSTCRAHSLHSLASLEPSVARGITYPFDRRGISQRRLLEPLTAAALVALRRLLPVRIDRLLDRARASVAVLHHSVVSPAAVARAHARQAAALAWTVDDDRDLARVLDAGVDGVITNDPRILQRRN